MICTVKNLTKDLKNVAMKYKYSLVRRRNYIVVVYSSAIQKNIKTKAEAILQIMIPYIASAAY